MKQEKKRPANEEAEPPALSAGKPGKGGDEKAKESRVIAGFLPCSWNRDWLFALLLVFGTMAAYLPVRHAGFIWDDDSILLDNPLIRQAGGWYHAWFNRAADDFVPATITCLWLEWRLWGANPLGYHLDSVLLHVCNALLLWRILLRLKIPGAWLAAALFAVHPVNVESVAWITQRKNTLAMLLFLAAVQFYLTFEDSGRRRWIWLAAGMFLLALMGKTAVAPLPVVLLGLAWWRRGRIDRKDVQHSLIFIVLAAAGSLMAIWIQQGAAIGMTVRTDSFWARLAGAGWALWFYLGKALLPLKLNFVYPRWEIPAGSPLSYLPLVLWAAGLLICWRYRKGWGAGALLALGYFSVMLLPVLGFLNIYFMLYSLVSDHWQYFAIVGPLALAAAGFKAALAAMTGGNKWVTGICCATLLAGLGALTWQQCGMYANAETLWLKTIRLNPKCWMAQYNLGLNYFQQGQQDQAIAHFQKALEIRPDYAEAHNNLGFSSLQQGQLDQAIAHFQKALEIRPDYAEAHNNLGIGFFQLGRTDEAITQFQKAIEIEPDYAEARYNLGTLAPKGTGGRSDRAVPKGRGNQAGLRGSPQQPWPRLLRRAAWTKRSRNSKRRCKSNQPIQRSKIIWPGSWPLVRRRRCATATKRWNWPAGQCADRRRKSGHAPHPRRRLRRSRAVFPSGGNGATRLAPGRGAIQHRAGRGTSIGNETLPGRQPIPYPCTNTLGRRAIGRMFRRRKNWFLLAMGRKGH